MSAKPPFSEQQVFAKLFASRAALNGEVIRRKAADVDRFIGRPAFLREVGRRGFRVLENAGQFIIICNAEPIRRVI